MATLFQGLGAVTSNSFDSNKLLLSSRRSLKGSFFLIVEWFLILGFSYNLMGSCIIIDHGCYLFHFVTDLISERKGSIFVVRSDAKVNKALKTCATRKGDLLIPNAVAVSYLFTHTLFHIFL